MAGCLSPTQLFENCVDWKDWDDDGIITDDEILAAVYCWPTDTAHNGHVLTDEDILELVYMWLTG